MKRAATLLAILGLGIAARGAERTTGAEPLPTLEAITVQNVSRLELLRTLQIPGYKKGAVSQCSVAFSPDGRLLVEACGESQVPIWDVQTGSIVRVLYETPQHIVACAFSSDGRRLACGGFDNAITLWDSLDRRDDGWLRRARRPGVGACRQSGRADARLVQPVGRRAPLGPQHAQP